jgi:hypothetical protein
MRPLAQKLALAVLALTGLVALAAGIAPSALPAAGAALVRTALSAGDWAATTARAEEMKFTPLPPESTSALESRPVRHRASTITPPEPPEPPAPPPPNPKVVIGKPGDVTRVGSDITIGRDEVITGDVTALGGGLRVQGHIEGDAVAIGGDIYLDSTARVDGDVVCMGGELHEEPGAIVSGKKSIVGLGRHGGRLARALAEREVAVRTQHHVGGALGWLLVWLLIGWVTVKLAPGRTGAAVEEIRRSPGASFLLGWLAIVLTVPGLIAVALLVALLCITIIGIPLGIALLFAYFLFLGVFAIWGGVVGAAFLGERVAQRQGGAAASLMRVTMYGLLVINGAMVGAEVMKLMGFIPFFSGFGKFFKVLFVIASALIGVTGWGALLRSEFTTGWIARRWRGRRGDGGVGPVPVPAGPSPGPGGPTIVTTVPSASAAGFASPAPGMQAPPAVPPPPVVPPPPSVPPPPAWPPPSPPAGGGGPPPAP